MSYKKLGIALFVLMFAGIAGAKTLVPIKKGNRVFFIPVNLAPKAVADQFTLSEDETPTLDVLSNDDDDADLANATIQIVSAPLHGTAGVVNGKIDYVPVENYHGTDALEYAFLDEGGKLSNTVSVSLTINPVNDAPVIQAVPVQNLNEDNSVSIPLTSSDVDSSPGAISFSCQSDNPGLLPCELSNLTGTGYNRNLNLIPTANASGSASITVTVSDGESDSDTTFAVNFQAVNDAPSLQAPGAQGLSEDTPKTVSLNSYDIDSAAASLVFTCRSSNPGVLPCQQSNITGSGFIRTLNLIPAANASGVANITVSVSDDGGTVNTVETVFLATVSSVNDAPVLQFVSPQTFNEDTVHQVNLLASDVDTPAYSMSFTCSSSNPGLLPCDQSHLSGSGFSRTLNLTPVANSSGTANISVSVSDGSKSATQVFVATVTPVNDAPTATSLSDITLAEDSIININPVASDIEGGVLTPHIAQQPTNGTAAIANGQLRYVPGAHFNGADSFAYYVTDSDNAPSDPATVTITVTAVNDEPTATNVPGITLAEDSSININPVASDIEGGVLTPHIDSQPSNGTAAIANGQLRYVPGANFNGADSFTYYVTDSDNAPSAPATVTITVTAVNDEPTATNVPGITLAEDSSININPVASDIEGGVLTPHIGSQPSNGTAAIANGQLRYVPGANFNGPDSFTYYVTDSDNAPSAPATVTITVTPVNDAPTVPPFTVSVTEDSLDNLISPQGADIDGDALTYSLVTNAANGNVEVAGNQFSYSPNLNYVGQDSFTYRATDPGGAMSGTATVTINITPVNDAPVAANDTAQTNENTPVLLDVLANDSDVDNDPLTLASATLTSGVGTVQVTADNKIQFSPGTGFSGIATIQYEIKDPANATASAIVTVTVIEVNSPPQISGNPPNIAIVSQTYNFTPDSTDADGDVLSFTFQGLPAWLQGNAQTGNITGQPLVAHIGQSSLIGIKVSDPHGAIDHMAFTLVVVAQAVSVTIDSPADQDDVLHGPITVSASVSDEAQTKRVEFRHNNGAWQADTDGVFPWNFTFSEPQPGSNSFQARVINQSDAIALSGVVQVNVLLGMPSVTITLPDPAVRSDFNVSWETVSGASLYTLQERIQDGPWSTVISQAGTSYSYTGKQPQSYSYRVRAEANGIEGQWSFVKTYQVALEVGQCPVE